MTVHPSSLRPTKSAVPVRSSISRPVAMRCRYNYAIGNSYHSDAAVPSFPYASQTSLSFLSPPASPRASKFSTSSLAPSRPQFSRVSPPSSPPLASTPAPTLEPPSTPPPIEDSSAEPQPVVVTPTSPEEGSSKRRVVSFPAFFTFSDSEEEDDNSVCSNSDDEAALASSGVEHSPLRPSGYMRSRRVQFATQITVREIPDRHAYSDQTKQMLWNSRRQIRRAASRNSFEYAWEGHNWRTAVEEEHFLPLQGGRQWIHPAHLRHWEKQQQKEQWEKEQWEKQQQWQKQQQQLQYQQYHQSYALEQQQQYPEQQQQYQYYEHQQYSHEQHYAHYRAPVEVVETTTEPIPFY